MDASAFPPMAADSKHSPIEEDEKSPVPLELHMHAESLQRAAPWYLHRSLFNVNEIFLAQVIIIKGSNLQRKSVQISEL